ncbi:hypothetical protein PIB30_031244 [Stylosanthes scabra]|uniref:Secreted protein n=1 Tax=Stylosanthes scabra TaxID=79078 RepID=A0ABU6VB95_9FABA|nr:hypothetical protein [Stylosanthes scabra]
MLRKRWVKKLDNLISTFWFLPFVHHLVGNALLAGVTDSEAKNCHHQALVRVCASVRVGAQALKTGVWALVGECMWGREMLGAQALKTSAWALGVCFGCAGSVCGRPGLGVGVVVQEGGVGVLGAPRRWFWAPSFSAALSRGVSGVKPIVNYRLLYIEAKPRMLTF